MPNKQTVKPDFSIEMLASPGVAAASPTSGKVTTPNFAVFLPKHMTEWFLTHELKHVEQFKVVARSFAGLTDDIGKGLDNFGEFMQKQTVLVGDNFNKEFYKKVVKKEGVIKQGTPDAKRAEKYIQAMKDYPDMLTLNRMEQLAKSIETQAKYEGKNPLEIIKLSIKDGKKAKKQLLKRYKTNPLEIEANQASIDYAKSVIKTKAKEVAGKVADKLGLRKSDTARRADNPA